MSIVYLNGSYLPIEEAKISPLDRGFLFGDGIYEVIPSYEGKMVGFGPHIDRMIDGLAALDIKLGWGHEQWKDLCDALVDKNGGGNLGIYLHVSRGADNKRFHAFPEGVEPTVFCMAFEIPLPQQADRNTANAYKVATGEDLRWKRCNIKSTALLGNVLHFQEGYAAGNNEILLFNAEGNLTEAGACNVFIVKDGVVATPKLDNQILPGITRMLILSILRKDGSITVEERDISKQEVLSADEVWITSSSKEMAPVIEIDGQPVGDGKVGEVWEAATKLYAANKFDY
ncbi:D-amino acid aminotransferase [Motiliproteus sp.]|uniref:D-amino acid aminotransferase n=1 Tax=Motiliproteus sp. TaxID=1898955 RepID=UPI003BAA2C45